jgi:hypothetical protein
VTLGWGDERSTAMSSKSSPAVATMGIDIGKNSFHVIGLDARGAIALRQKWSRGQYPRKQPLRPLNAVAASAGRPEQENTSRTLLTHRPLQWLSSQTASFGQCAERWFGRLIAAREQRGNEPRKAREHAPIGIAEISGNPEHAKRQNVHDS